LLAQLGLVLNFLGLCLGLFGWVLLQEFRRRRAHQKARARLRADSPSLTAAE